MSNKYPNRYRPHSYDYVKSFIETQSDCKLLSESYKGTDKKLRIECYCGKEFETTFTKFKGRNQRQCKDCGKEIKRIKLSKTDDDFQKQIYDLVGNEYVFLEPYINASIKILCKHNVCGHTWTIKPSHFIDGRRCPKCAGCNLKTDDEFRQQVYDLVGDEYVFLEPYVNRATKLRCLHTLCGNIWSVTPHNFANVNTRCPICVSSRGELELMRCLKKYPNIIIEHQYSFGELLGLGGQPLKFDFAIYNNSQDLILLIEYDGEQHYRPIDFHGRGEESARKDFQIIQTHDNYKNDYCIKNHIPLLRISYTEFENIETILNNQLEILAS